MSLSGRMIVATSLAVAFAVIFGAAASYIAVDHSLRERMDQQLRGFANALAPLSEPPPRLRPHFSGRRRPPGQLRSGLEVNGRVAIFDSRGGLLATIGPRSSFRITARDRLVAAGRAAAYYRTERVAGKDRRIFVKRAGHGQAVLVEQSLGELQDTLHRLATILFAIAIAGVVLAGFLGLLAARWAARPVHVLREAAERVRTTGDLSGRIKVAGNDDLGRLGVSFNEMLGALERSQAAQRQLVADASHELRTPIASLRTNLEVLARNPDLPPAERSPLLHDVICESTELGELVKDLLDSARAAETEPARELALDELVASEILRAAVIDPSVHWQINLKPCSIDGRDAALRRAIGNVLVNAVKWSPPGGFVQVALSPGCLEVRDFGPGFEETDLPRIFDRFYRSEASRGVPGSGLGLAIARKVTVEHGGQIYASNAPGGGAIVTFRLPAASASAGVMAGARTSS